MAMISKEDVPVLLARQLITIGSVALAVASCSSSTSPSGGSLTVTVTPPSGVTPAVTVTGPNSYHTIIASTERLTALAPGSYTITAASAASSNPIVVTRYSATVSGSPANVSAGATAAATVTYSARMGSGGLWVVGGTATGSNIQNAAMEYSAAQLATSGATSPATTLQFPLTTGLNINANGVAFDPQGNLWVVNENTNTAVKYAAATLGSSDSPTPAATLHVPVSTYGQSLAFDANGDLWVSTADSSSLVEFTAQQLQAGGNPTPAVTIMVVPDRSGTPRQPFGLAFDARGNLWVAAYYSGVISYTPSQLASSGAPVPTTIITTPFPSPYYLAFDTGGNLWVASAPYGSNNFDSPGLITEFKAATLTASGSPTPAVTLTLPNGVHSFPTAIAFDQSGDLWYLDFTHAIVGEFAATQLGATGAPSPVVTITTKPFYGVALAFDP